MLESSFLASTLLNSKDSGDIGTLPSPIQALIISRHGEGSFLFGARQASPPGGEVTNVESIVFCASLKVPDYEIGVSDSG